MEYECAYVWAGGEGGGRCGTQAKPSQVGTPRPRAPTCDGIAFRTAPALGGWAVAPTGAPGRGGDGFDGAPRPRCGCAATAAAASNPRTRPCSHQSRRARPCYSARPGAYGEQQEGVTTHGTGHRLQRAARLLVPAGRVLGSTQPSGWIEPSLGPTPGVHPGWRLLRDPKGPDPPLAPGTGCRAAVDARRRARQHQLAASQASAAKGDAAPRSGKPPNKPPVCNQEQR